MLAKELIQVLGLRAIVLQAAPQETEDALDAYLEECAEIYARHFTGTEIDALMAFCNTPAGQKALQAMPAIMQECTEAAIRCLRE